MRCPVLVSPWLLPRIVTELPNSVYSQQHSMLVLSSTRALSSHLLDPILGPHSCPVALSTLAASQLYRSKDSRHSYLFQNARVHVRWQSGTSQNHLVPVTAGWKLTKRCILIASCRSLLRARFPFEKQLFS